MGWLTDDDLRQFAVDGYLVVREVVPKPLLAAADAEIDHLIEKVTPHEGDRGPGQNAWFPPCSQLPRSDDVLRQSPALDIAQELVSPNTLDHAFDHIQVATTVPLAGVLLTDQQAPGSGNLWVWPGSHLHHERLFHERGTRVLHRTGGHATLLEPPATLNAPVPITGGRGDLLLAHFLLGHNKGGNTAPHERRTIYYRLAVPGHEDRWEQTFLDVWTEYPRVRRDSRRRASST